MHAGTIKFYLRPNPPSCLFSQINGWVGVKSYEIAQVTLRALEILKYRSWKLLDYVLQDALQASKL